MEKISGKNVLVCGATGAVGYYAAKLLKQSGANLFLCGRNENRLNEIASELNIPSDQLFVLALEDEHSVNEMASKIHEKIQAIDIIINAAGIGIIKPIESLSSADFLTSLNANLIGPFHLLKAFLPAMKETKKGLIINIPGVLGKTPMAGAAAYSASKYGLNGMLKSVREELKRTDIRITNVFFGGIDSAFWDNIDLRVQRDKMIQAEEAGRAIWFLCQQPVSGVVSEMVIQPFNHQAI